MNRSSRVPGVTRNSGWPAAMGRQQQEPAQETSGRDTPTGLAPHAEKESRK